MSESLEAIKEYRHQILRDLLAQCNPNQVDIFNRMYGSIDTIPHEKMDWAIQQCERTIRNNKAKDSSL